MFLKIKGIPNTHALKTSIRFSVTQISVDNTSVILYRTLTKGTTQFENYQIFFSLLEV